MPLNQKLPDVSSIKREINFANYKIIEAIIEFYSDGGISKDEAIAQMDSLRAWRNNLDLLKGAKSAGMIDEEEYLDNLREFDRAKIACLRREHNSLKEKLAELTNHPLTSPCSQPPASHAVSLPENQPAPSELDPSSPTGQSLPQ